MQDFLRIFCLFGLPIFLVAALFILNLAANPHKSTRSIADRIAWTIFAFGICLMLTMVLYTMTQEGDGDWRSWSTVRLHSRVFLALSVIPIAGPLMVYLIQFVRARRSPAGAKKAAVDDWESGPPFRS
jgi:hypothetical protein